MQELDRDRSRQERRIGGAERGSRGQDESRAEQLPFLDHGLELWAAARHDGSKSVAAYGELTRVTDCRRRRNHVARRRLGDSLGLGHDGTFAGSCEGVKDAA